MDKNTNATPEVALQLQAEAPVVEEPITENTQTESTNTESTNTDVSNEIYFKSEDSKRAFENNGYTVVAANDIETIKSMIQ